MGTKKHLRQMQLEKQRFEWATKCHDEWSYRSFKTSIELKAKTTTKTIILIIIATGSIMFSQWSIISELIKGVI